MTGLLLILCVILVGVLIGAGLENNCLTVENTLLHESTAQLAADQKLLKAHVRDVELELLACGGRVPGGEPQ